MRILLNPNYSNIQYCTRTFKSKNEVLHEVGELGGLVTGAKRLEELGKAETEMDAWKVAMKMADYGNPVRHAAWIVSATKGAAIGSCLGPVGSLVGGAVGFLASNFLCNKVRNKTLDTIADWADGD